jgi:thiamine-phosphate pyrophosphorylase
MAQVLRILDANANRAREALRVMEEAARFLLDDEPLARALKTLRHDLADVLRGLLPGDMVELHRDTPADVGTRIATAAEMTRASVADVAAAAGKRLSEALRVIEEYAKTLAPPAADDPAAFPGAGPVQQLRYRGYELERQLQRALSPMSPRPWKLCLLLTEALCAPLSWSDVLQRAIAGGVDCVQVREKTMEDGALLTRVRQVIAVGRPKGATVIVNDRPDLALAADADGVHLGQGDLPVAAVRKLAGRRLIIGVSTSRLDEAQAARAAGADYCGVGPMFPTTTKEKNVIVGPAYLRQYLAWNQLPHLAIGGITPANLPQLAAAGVRGIAVSSAICAAHDPETVARRLRESLP